MAKDTLFTNSSGAASGAVDYVKDVFQDISLEANSNGSLTSNQSNNPLDFALDNGDSPRFGVKTLYIKDLVLLDNRSSWVSNKPTYKVIFNESYPQINAYIFGNVQITSENGQTFIQVKTIGDGIGITSLASRIAFLVNDDTSATATAQVAVDGVNTTTIDFSNLSTNADASFGTRYSAFVHSTSNEASGIHDIRLTALQANTLKLVGLVVYFENAGANIECAPGTSYVNKAKVTALTGATLTVPSYGSSLGGKALIYKSQSTGYAVVGQAASSIISIAQGSSGTNLLNVSTGHGASFVAGYGVVVTQGTSHYVGSVVSVSTDTLTVSPTLPFGLSNVIYTAWRAGSTQVINPSMLIMSNSIKFSNYSSLTAGIIDPTGKYAFYGQNIGVTTVDGVRAALFNGTSGFMQIDGYMAACEIEYIGNGILHATYSVNGLPAYGLNAGQTGAIKMTVFTAGGANYTNVNITPGNSLGTVGINQINFYELARDLSVSYGMLAEFDTLNSFAERSVNATQMMLGTHRRVYPDQLYLKGGWVREFSAKTPGSYRYIGSSTNSQILAQYYGKNFAFGGTAGAGSTLLLNGSGVNLAFNRTIYGSTEMFNTVLFTNGSATTVIEFFDYTRVYGETKSLQNYSYAKKIASSAKKNYIVCQYGTGFGSTANKIRRFTNLVDYSGNILYTRSSADGDSFQIQEDGIYEIYYSDNYASASTYYGASKNSDYLTTFIYQLTYEQGLVMIGNGEATSQVGQVSRTVHLKKGDIIRAHTAGLGDVGSPVTLFSIIQIA